jgi:hypothetical protein
MREGGDLGVNLQSIELKFSSAYYDNLLGIEGNAEGLFVESTNQKY